MRVAIIGGGNMGAAYARCFLKKGIASRADLIIVERGGDRRDELSAEFGCRVQGQADRAVAEAEAVLLAVKPQDMQPMCDALCAGTAPKNLVISIMAGIPLARLSGALGGLSRLVRCMPNMPVQVGEGMTVYFPCPGLPQDDCDLVERLLCATGLCLQLDREDLMNAATALSGSGPGYVFYILEHALKAARDLGFSAAEAELLMAQTFHGAVEQWRGSRYDAADLKAMVTSKGGTTAAALEVFEAAGMGRALEEGIKRAAARAAELGKPAG